MRIHQAIHRLLGIVIHGDLGPYTMYTSHDRGLVVYLNSPPKTPPSPDQQRIRNRFRCLATTWRALSDERKTEWAETAARARLRVHGYTLFTWYAMSGDIAALKTAARIAKTTITGITDL